MWRRVWDSNPRAQRANGFQDRLVMTTSITLRRVSLAKCSGIWREFRERTMKFLYDGKCRKPLILQGFWGNKRNSYARVFKTASLWPLRYPSEWNEERIEMWLDHRRWANPLRNIRRRRNIPPYMNCRSADFIGYSIERCKKIARNISCTVQRNPPKTQSPQGFLDTYQVNQREFFKTASLWPLR